MSEKHSVHIVDTSWLCYVGLYSQRFLECDGIKTGGMFHILNTALKLRKDNPKDKIIFAMDGENGKDKRLALYPDYKKGRKKDGIISDFGANIAVGALCAPLVGNCMSIKHDDYEADDLICTLMYDYKLNDSISEIHIYGTDKDFYQQASEKTFFHSNLEDPPKTIDDVFKIFPVSTIVDILLYRAARGDSSDNIPAALPRIPEKILVPEIISKYHSNEISTTSKWGSLFHKNREIFERNLKIMASEYVVITHEEIYTRDYPGLLSTQKEMLERFKLNSIIKKLGI